MVVGELSLDGEIRPVRRILPVTVATREHEFEQLILPKANEAEAAVVEGIRRVPDSTLSEVVQYLKVIFESDLLIMIQQKSFLSNSILKRIFKM